MKGTYIGAGIGITLFLVFGLIPSFHFGGFGTMMLITHLTGNAVEPGLIARLAVIMGILVGMFCMGSVFIVVFSVLGTVIQLGIEHLGEIFVPSFKKSRT